MGTKVLSIAERGKLYEEMRGTIVCIHDKTNGDIIGGGTFLVVGSSRLVLTTAHVADEEDDLYIVTYGKKIHDVNLVHLDSERDVALLAVVGQDDDFKCAELCETNELSVGSEIHFIGHPGRQTFSYNIGNICCIEKTCGYIYDFMEIEGYLQDKSYQSYQLIDDFRGLARSLKLLQAKNVHGGGRFGGTGAPFLDSDGSIVGLYSFTFREEDNAIHVADIKASIESFSRKLEEP